jgi:hypothetical protein
MREVQLFPRLLTRVANEEFYAQITERFLLLLEHAKNEADFLKAVRSLWHHYQRHFGHDISRKGRPSAHLQVFGAIADALLKSNRSVFAQVSIGQLTRMAEETGRVSNLDPDTIRKYCKLWLLMHTDPQKLSVAQWSWLAKHDSLFVRTAMGVRKGNQIDKQIVKSIRQAIRSLPPKYRSRFSPA